MLNYLFYVVNNLKGLFCTSLLGGLFSFFRSSPPVPKYSEKGVGTDSSVNCVNAAVITEAPNLIDAEVSTETSILVDRGVNATRPAPLVLQDSNHIIPPVSLNNSSVLVDWPLNGRKELQDNGNLLQGTQRILRYQVGG